jgi:hypothetical protein
LILKFNIINLESRAICICINSIPSNFPWHNSIPKNFPWHNSIPRNFPWHEFNFDLFNSIPNYLTLPAATYYLEAAEQKLTIHRGTGESEDFDSKGEAWTVDNVLAWAEGARKKFRNNSYPSLECSKEHSIINVLLSPRSRCTIRGSHCVIQSNLYHVV